MHSPWSRAAVDPDRAKPRANSGLSFTGAHFLDSQHTTPTTRSHSLPVIPTTNLSSDLDSTLWGSQKNSPLSESNRTVAVEVPASQEATPSIYRGEAPIATHNQFQQENWLSYAPAPGLHTVTEEPADLEAQSEQAATADSANSLEVQTNHKESNMSVCSYVYPTALDHFDRSAHYHSPSGSITSEPSLSAYDLTATDNSHDQSLSPLDVSAPQYSLGHDFPPSQVINALASGASNTSSPMSAKEQELLRQRRKTQHTIRRQSKTKLRRQRSTTDASYLPRSSVSSDYGLGIQYSSAPGMAASITSQPVAPVQSNYIEHYDESMSPTAQQLYGSEYYAQPPEYALDGFQIPYAMPVSSESPHAMYAPYSVVPSLPAMTVSATGHPVDAVYTQMNGRLSHSPSADDQVRVITARPKPQCWDHGCNGRQFSTFSNLLRHQREKSGTATKSYCPKCGAEFTRTTARNGHMAHEKCKSRTDA